MKWLQLFLIGCVAISLDDYANAQRTFLDDLRFRPAFRKIREVFLNLTKNQSPELAYQTNLRLGVNISSDSC